MNDPKLLPRSLPLIPNRSALTARSKRQVQVLQLLQLGNQQIKTEKIIVTDKPGMNVFIEKSRADPFFNYRSCIRGCLHEKTRTGASFMPG